MAAFLVIGLNALGRRLARELHDRGHKVTAADISQDRINRICHEIPSVVRLDTTDRDALKELTVPQFDHVIVCMGHRFEVAERTTLALRDEKAQGVTNVATTEVRAEILRRIGADRVVTPGLDLARNLAVSLDDKRIDRFIFVDDELGFAEIAVNQPITLTDDWRDLLGDGCVVTGIRRENRSEDSGRAEIANLAGVCLEVGDHLLVYGDPEIISERLNRFFK
ncbi:MAG: Trk K+ transport system NAD-binding subunit [Planctomycetota bacterium]|jgi:Trk K+ transport system NAD-binding subunit